MNNKVVPLFDPIPMQLRKCDLILDELRADVFQQVLRLPLRPVRRLRA
jgi:hypothetical protein